MNEVGVTLPIRYRCNNFRVITNQRVLIESKTKSSAVFVRKLDTSMQHGSEDNSRRSRPPPPKWLNVDFFQKSLRREKNDPQLLVESAAVDYACGPSETVASGVFRASVDLRRTDGAAETLSVIIKCFSEDVKMSTLTGVEEMFNRETLMYTNVIGEIESLLVASGMYEPIFAKLLWCGDDPTWFLVWEDLAESGFYVERKHRGLDLEHSLLVVRTLAKFHGATATLLQNDSTLGKDFLDCIKYSPETVKGLKEILTVMAKILAEDDDLWVGFPDDMPRRILPLGDRILDAMGDLRKSKPGSFKVLLHGDLWKSNIMFQYDDGKARSVRFVDLQTPLVSSPTHDLVYFLYSSINADVEVNHFDQLIAEYHKCLTETLESLNYTGVGYSLQNLKDELEDIALETLHITMFVSCLGLATEDDNLDFEEAVRDKDYALRKVISNPAYTATLKRRLPLFIEKGIL